jgi:hypothetical protein
MSILTWNDIYFQLWTQASQSRGTVTTIGEPSGHEGYSTIPEWPRTTGGDVIAMATLVDPILAALPLRPGGYGITRLWQTAVIDLEGFAFVQPSAEYLHNRSFWSTLLAVASYLDTMGAPLPLDEALETLVDMLWSPVEYRNAGGPTTKTITEGTTEKMWNAQRDEMMKARGFDVREPTAAIGGTAMKVPRTTNADIVRLADYWGKQLAAFVPKAFFGGVPNTMGLQGQLKRWSAVMDDVDKLARKGKPDELYPKNHEFWHETIGLATNLAVWGEQPSTFELAVESTKQAAADLPGRIAGAAGAVAKAVGDVAREAGAGLLSGMGKPLLIGGGVLVGLLLLFRRGRAREAT